MTSNNWKAVPISNPTPFGRPSSSTIRTIFHTSDRPDRVAAAIKHSGFESPKQRNQKIVISLAPADLKKEGPLFDLPIALSYLLAADDIRFEPDEYLFVGELSLDGTLRGVRGILPLAAEAKRQGKKAVFVPTENAKEAESVHQVSEKIDNQRLPEQLLPEVAVLQTQGSVVPALILGTVVVAAAVYGAYRYGLMSKAIAWVEAKKAAYQKNEVDDQRISGAVSA